MQRSFIGTAFHNERIFLVIHTLHRVRLHDAFHAIAPALAMRNVAHCGDDLPPHGQRRARR